MTQIKIHIPDQLLEQLGSEPNKVIRMLINNHVEKLQNNDPLDNVMSCQEAAEKWDLAPGYIKNLCNKGEIKAKNIGKTWIIDKNQPNPKKY